jgi:hypothetical protein
MFFGKMIHFGKASSLAFHLAVQKTEEEMSKNMLVNIFTIVCCAMIYFILLVFSSYVLQMVLDVFMFLLCSLL